MKRSPDPMPQVLQASSLIGTLRKKDLLRRSTRHKDDNDNDSIHQSTLFRYISLFIPSLFFNRSTTIYSSTMDPLENVDEYHQDGPVAKKIAKYIPFFPFKGIDRFYDIGGFLYHPKIFELIVDVFYQRYRTKDVDVIAGYVH